MAALVALPCTRSAASPIAPQPVCNQALPAARVAGTGRLSQQRPQAAAAAAASAAAMSARPAAALGSLQQLPDTYRGALLDQFGELRRGLGQRQSQCGQQHSAHLLAIRGPSLVAPSCHALTGVLHDGTKPYPGAIEAVSQLAERGMRLLIISNSSRRELGPK